MVKFGYGRTNRPTLRPEPSKVCEFCGKVALYRYEDKGRCSDHKGIPSAATLAVRSLIERKASHEESLGKAKDRKTKHEKTLHNIRPISK